VAAMSFKRKFNTPTKMAAPTAGNDDDDDVTPRRAYDSQPSSGHIADSSYWSPVSTSSADASLFPDPFADAGRLLDFRKARKSSPEDRRDPQLDRERKTEAADGGDPWRQPEVDGGDDVMGNIRSVIGSASSLDEKQRVLTMMISQLQSLKQNLFQQKSNGVRIHTCIGAATAEKLESRAFQFAIRIDSIRFVMGIDSSRLV